MTCNCLIQIGETQTQQSELLLPAEATSGSSALHLIHHTSAGTGEAWCYHCRPCLRRAPLFKLEAASLAVAVQVMMVGSKATRSSMQLTSWPVMRIPLKRSNWGPCHWQAAPQMTPAMLSWGLS